MDWNWFYSSIAQSAAAIVGIFGAFIITKILGNQATFSQKTNKCRDVITQCQRVVDAANHLSIDWYNRHTNNEEFRKLKELLEESEELTPEQYYDKLYFSAYYPRSKTLDAIQKVIAGFKAMKEREWKEQQARSNPGFASITATSMRLPTLDMNLHMRVPLEKEQESIEAVYRDAKHHMRLASDALSTIKNNPESSNQITYALILVTVLFFFGVIYPLSFLPVSSAGVIDISVRYFFPTLLSFKGFLLTIVSLVFCAVLVMFFWLNLALRYSAELVAELSKFIRVESYSTDFEILESNRTFSAGSHNG